MQGIRENSILNTIEPNQSIPISEIVSWTNLDTATIVKEIWELELLWILQYDYKDDTNIENSKVSIWNISHLDQVNISLHQSTLVKKSEIEKERKLRGYINYQDYNLNKLKNDIADALSWYDSIQWPENLDIWFIDKNKFKWDITLKIPYLLQKYSKWWIYIREKIPEIVDILNKSELAKNWKITSVDIKGIYINIELWDEYLFSCLDQVLELWDKYWESDIHKWESIVIDYSWPNTAKHLHAWHIRSTIIWHILSNLYSATWYYAHRVNHLNDWWGFWQLIEWYERWKDILPKFEVENDMLFHIYSMYRKWEKYSDPEQDITQLSSDEVDELKKYYWGFNDKQEFEKSFQAFLSAAEKRFSNLEKWEKHEVDIWKEMVKWSMEDFKKFYDILWIHQDYTMWESFYWNMWRNLVKNLEKEWKVVFYTEKLANKDIQELNEKFKKWEIEETVFYTEQREILDDVWCYLVPLPNFERFVVLKSDESTIYATRDLAAINYRTNTFSPSRIVYEVWQEQAEHFDKLFKSAKKSWIENIDFSHIYHGFYIDADTKKKLSSRDGASNVQNLIHGTIEYFKSKYDEDTKGLSSAEIEDVSHKLGIWSIIFNDIKKDKKTAVLMNSDIKKTCEIFEDSGWAYIMYNICRANSILRRAWERTNSTISFKIEKLEEKEKEIINEINNYPHIVLQASEKDDPSILTTFLYKLARAYSSYYKSSPVLQEWCEYRLVITQAVAQVLKNGMKLCHIECPERI